MGRDYCADVFVPSSDIILHMHTFSLYCIPEAYVCQD